MCGCTQQYNSSTRVTKIIEEKRRQICRTMWLCHNNDLSRLIFSAVRASDNSGSLCNSVHLKDLQMERNSSLLVLQKGVLDRTWSLHCSNLESKITVFQPLLLKFCFLPPIIWPSRQCREHACWLSEQKVTFCDHRRDTLFLFVHLNIRATDAQVRMQFVQILQDRPAQ